MEDQMPLLSPINFYRIYGSHDRILSNSLEERHYRYDKVVQENFHTIDGP